LKNLYFCIFVGRAGEGGVEVWLLPENFLAKAIYGQTRFLTDFHGSSSNRIDCIFFGSNIWVVCVVTVVNESQLKLVCEG
jgi:hypothetical protein